jgi:hypothetical protein
MDSVEARSPTANETTARSEGDRLDSETSYGNASAQRTRARQGIPYDPSGRDSRTGALCGTPLVLVGTWRRRPSCGMSVDIQARRRLLVDTPGPPTPVPFTPAHRQAGLTNVRTSAMSVRSVSRARRPARPWRPRGPRPCMAPALARVVCLLGHSVATTARCHAFSGWRFPGSRYQGA